MLLFSPSLAGLMAGRGILVPMGMTTNATSNVTTSLTVFAGEQPPADDISNNWDDYNDAYLFHMRGVEYKLSNPTSNTLCGLISNANYPTSEPALNTSLVSGGGGASWCVIWCSDISSGSAPGELGDIAVPNTQFIVGPVTLYSGNGIVRLSNLSITSGLTYNFVDSTMFFNKI